MAPSLCLPATAAPSPPWTFAPGEGDGIGYVFVSGDSHDRDRVATAIATAGGTVGRFGPNLSGDEGDWFIRLSGLPPQGASGLISRLTELLGQPYRPHEPLPSTTRERLLAQQLVATIAERDRLAAILAKHEPELKQAALNIAGLRQALDAAQAEMAAASTSPPQSHEVQKTNQNTRASGSAATRLVAEFKAVVAVLLPRIELTEDSLQFMAIELQERTSLWRSLASLNNADRDPAGNWKRVASAKDWWEKHFSTGQDDQGRVYARHDPASRRWQVLVSHKQDQQRDLRRLARR